MSEFLLDTPAPSPTAGRTRSSLDRVLDAMRAAGLSMKSDQRGSTIGTCPVHEDATPSMNVTWRQGARGGCTLVHCFGCGASAADIVEALGLSMQDLFDEPLAPRQRHQLRVGKTPEQRLAARRRGRLGRLPCPIAAASEAESPAPEHVWREVERYCYTRVDDTLVQVVVRQECTSESAPHKSFRQEFTGASGRTVARKPSGFVPVLYRARAVADAIAAGQMVWLMEGEKDVHSAEAHHLVATTNAQGGGAFPEALIGALAGADVNVVLDRDATGWNRGVELHTKLTAVGARVRLKVPALEVSKADFTDHVDAKLAVSELLDVHVAEVATWQAHAAVETKARALAAAVAEVDAHQDLVRAGDDPAVHREHAVRWAMEVQVRHEALSELAAGVHTRGMVVGTLWAAAAIDDADRQLEAATSAAHDVHLRAEVALPPSLNPALSGQPPGAAQPSSPGKKGEDGAEVSRSGGGASAPTFRVVDGQIVEWVPTRGRPRSSEDGEEEGNYRCVLSTVVRLAVREFYEGETDADVEESPLMGRATERRRRVPAQAQLVAVRLRYPDPVTGQVMEIRVEADAWKDHSWLASLPGVVDYDHKRAGLDTVQRAIMAVSPGALDQVLHRSTGWRQLPDGSHHFIHARGAIAAAGHVDADVDLSGALARYDLPDPTSDVAALREAFLGHSAAMLEVLPARVGAPLLGQVFRSVIGHNPWVLSLVGSPGSYKTSVASKAMHHLGERWDHTRPASSMSGNGDTFNTLRFKLHNAKDVLYWMDDFAPTKSWLDAQKHLEETARLLHNQEARGRTSRDGLSVTTGSAPRASGLCTSEVMPRPGSGSERMLVVPLARGDVDPDTLFPLDEAPSRHARALTLSTFISWLARDLSAHRARYAALARDYAEHLAAAGQSIRQAAAIAETRAGWAAMTDCLTELGAITEAERDALLETVDQGLAEAGQAAVDPDLPRTTGARVLELLRYALGQGIAYVDDVRTGEPPPWPLNSRLGWRRQHLDLDAYGVAQRTRYEARGIRLGWVMHDPGARDRGRMLMCESTQLEAVLKSASATQAERLEIDRATALRALDDLGALVRDTSDRARWTIKCTVHTEARTARLVAIRLDDLLGDGEDPKDQHDLDAAPEPPPPDGAAPTVEGAAATSPPSRPAPPSPPALFTPLTPEPTGDAAPADNAPVTTGTSDESAPQEKDQEPAMEPHPDTPRPRRDAEEVTGFSTMDNTPHIAPCALCALPAVPVISGVRIHLTCWERSTAAQRAAAAAGEATPAAAASSEPVPAQHAENQSADPERPAPQPTNAQQESAPATPVPATPAAAAPGQRFAAAAAIVDLDGIWCSNGEHHRLEKIPAHIGDLADLVTTLKLGTQITKYLPARGQVWLGAGLAAHLGIDVAAIEAAEASERDRVAREATRNTPAVVAAVEAGYRLGGREGDALGRWTRVWKDGGASAWLALLPAITGDVAAMPLLSGNPNHAALAHRIGLLAGALGHPFHLSSSTTGLDLLTALRWKGRETFFALHDPVPPALVNNVETDLNWCRTPTSEEAGHSFVHAYDRSGSYLAGVSGLDVGIGQAVHHEGETHFLKTPGYWRVEIPEAGDTRVPNPLDPRGANAGRTRWVTTPALEFALEQGYDPQVLEAWTWQDKARVFDPWYDRIRDARTALDTPDPDAQAARDQLKLIYASTIGMIGSSIHMAKRPGYAPERRHHIVAKARTNILRRIARIGAETGRWPVAVIADTVLYTSNLEDPVAAWPGGQRWLGRELGRYKVEASAPLAEQLPYLVGGAYKGKDALMNRAQER